MASTPILPLAVWASGTNQNSIPANDNALRIEALNRELISQATTAQPASPADGDTYIIAATHTGAQWAGFTPKDIAIFKGGTWYAWAPTEGLIVNVAGDQFKFDGGDWVATGGGGSGGVSSVNSQTGAVVLDTDDVSEGGANLYLTAERVQDIVGAFVVAGSNMTITYDDESNTLSFAAAGGGGGAVSSVNGKTGAVSLALDDLSDVSANSPTAGYFLSWNGTAWVAAAGGGGGGLTNWTDGISTVSPNDATTAAQFIAQNAATNVDAVISPKGSGAFQLNLANSTSSGGNKRGLRAVDLQMARDLAAQVASGQEAVTFGARNKSSGTSSTAFGDSNTASSTYTVSFGFQNIASAYGSTNAGGTDNSASGARSITLGGQYQSTRGITGLASFGAAGQSVADSGKRQGELYAWASNTANATPVKMGTNGGSGGSDNQARLNDDSLITLSGIVSARQGATGDAKSWSFVAAAKRDSGAGSTTLIGTPSVTVIGASAGASAWAFNVIADTSNGALALQVTGESSKTITWMASAMSAFISA